MVYNYLCIILEAIHSTSNLADKSVKEIETITSIWLSKASERSKITAS